jgi:hypothetical protein
MRCAAPRRAVHTFVTDRDAVAMITVGVVIANSTRRHLVLHKQHQLHCSVF